MRYSAHIQTKREIKYGSGYFDSLKQAAVYWWLCENGVRIHTAGNEGAFAEEWEIDKSDLESISENAYTPLREGTEHEVSADELRKFVKDLLDAPTGDPDYAWVSWF